MAHITKAAEDAGESPRKGDICKMIFGQLMSLCRRRTSPSGVYPESAFTRVELLSDGGTDADFANHEIAVVRLGHFIDQGSS